jgi:hypothetical protein
VIFLLNLSLFYFFIWLLIFFKGHYICSLKVIIFGSVRFLIKKIKPVFFKNRNRIRTGSNRFGSSFFFRFSYFGEKTGSNRFGSRFFQFGSVFFRFGSIFFCFGLIQFFRFQAYKIKTKPVTFFKILIYLIGFFYGSIFSVFFLVFSGF